ncbi:MAG TPA: serine/threonine-protein kinase [Pirellulales bacterium]|nr:serine/threonine-protein kinase [Pirellulales bacterium]
MTEAMVGLYWMLAPPRWLAAKQQSYSCLESLVTVQKSFLVVTFQEANGDGVFLDSELDALADMLRLGRSYDEIDRRAESYLLERGAMTAWERKHRAAGATSFLFGNHRLIAPVKTGETYEVLIGQHLFSGRMDVVKVMHRCIESHDQRVRHLNRIRLQSSIQSFDVVSVHDVGFTRGVNFAVVEHVRGADLRAYVRQHGALPMNIAAAVVSDVAAALQTVHSLGFIFGTLEPSKILVSQKGVVKLCDAGIAGRPGKLVPGTYVSRKTVDFLSPEAIAGDIVTPLSDVYSLGCVLYYAVTAKVPFPGGSEDDKRVAQLKHYPLDPRKLANNLDDAFVEVLVDMMAKKPAARIQSMEELAARLWPWISSNGMSSEAK